MAGRRRGAAGVDVDSSAAEIGLGLSQRVIGRGLVRFGIELGPWGDFADPVTLADLAREAEAAGWDGFFIWDAMVYDPPGTLTAKADPWVALAAVAMATETIRLGPMVTPLPRRRPWKVAREAVTLDHLARGRLVLGVGLGDPSAEEFAWFGERGGDHRTRARMLDEALTIIDGLWRGEPFSFDGEFYRLHEVTFLPRPLQQPRIPIWVGGYWPNKPPFRRAARWDGVQPGSATGQLSPDEVRDLVAYIEQHRTADGSFEVAASGQTTGGDLSAAAAVRPFAEAGATWWLEVAGDTEAPWPADRVYRRVRQGPPRA